jgi:3-oxoacyl-[acyl-carrier protein] reductase
MADLSGRVALVTGASQGIGRACAIVLAQRGATIALAARNEAKLNAVAQEIASAGGKAGVFKMDVGVESDIRNGTKAAIAQLGKIDILINNAGITRDMLAMRMKRSEWDDVINTNLTSAFVASQAVMSSMLKQRWGRIVNISSIFGQMGQTGQANYAASKAGVIGLTMALARELASRNITVNAVAPGWIQTAMTAGLPQELTDQVTNMIPLGRPGTDKEVATAVAFLASEDASYITGHVLSVNGGLLMG